MKEERNVIPQTIEYIEMHLQEDLNLDSIAKFTGYSKYHLNRVFKDKVGCTIHRYIQKRRLTEAARRLVFSDTPILDISFDAKYESQQAFTLAFRQLYEKTPPIYREEGSFLPKQVIFYNRPAQPLRKAKKPADKRLMVWNMRENKRLGKVMAA